MFPLGSVLFPHGVLPLRVFEPRYQALLDHCLAGDGAFGVVLIERGSEVGGGDTRFDHGTVARLVQVVDLEEGHRLALTVGIRRFKVREWLSDDPYPRAIVEELDDALPPDGLVDLVRSTEARLRRTLALRSEAGIDVGDVRYELSEEPAAAAYQLCVLAPLAALDRQVLLETDSAVERIERLDRLLGEQIEVLQRQLGSG